MIDETSLLSIAAALADQAAPGEQVEVDLEQGKTLTVRLQAIADTNDQGEVKLFYELNGQPRVIRVPDRAAAGAGLAVGR